MRVWLADTVRTVAAWLVGGTVLFGIGVGLSSLNPESQPKPDRSPSERAYDRLAAEIEAGPPSQRGCAGHDDDVESRGRFGVGSTKPTPGDDYDCVRSDRRHRGDGAMTVTTTDTWNDIAKGEPVQVAGMRGQFTFEGYSRTAAGEWVTVYGGSKNVWGKRGFRAVSPDRIRRKD
jgi:hypothetical protein